MSQCYQNKLKKLERIGEIIKMNEDSISIHYYFWQKSCMTLLGCLDSEIYFHSVR